MTMAHSEMKEIEHIECVNNKVLTIIMLTDTYETENEPRSV